jgi:DNA-binding NarL/FixJ family response regulator
MTIRVLVADDQPLMRTAYDMTLRTEEDLELIGNAADGARRSSSRAGSDPT